MASKKFFYHKEHDVIYAFNAQTAELVSMGFNTDLILVDEDDERVQRLHPAFQKKAKKKPEPVEVPESEVKDAKE